MAGTRKSNKKKEKRNGFSFFSHMDPDKKSLIFKGLGLLVCVFTVFTLVASVSYLMTWREDQSLMSDPAMPCPGIGKFCIHISDGCGCIQAFLLEQEHRPAEDDAYSGQRGILVFPDSGICVNALYL